MSIERQPPVDISARLPSPRVQPPPFTPRSDSLAPSVAVRQDYNFRAYAVRRIRLGFEQSKSASPEKLEDMLVVTQPLSLSARPD